MTCSRLPAWNLVSLATAKTKPYSRYGAAILMWRLHTKPAIPEVILDTIWSQKDRISCAKKKKKKTTSIDGAPYWDAGLDNHQLLPIAYQVCHPFFKSIPRSGTKKLITNKQDITPAHPFAMLRHQHITPTETQETGFGRGRCANKPACKKMNNKI